MQFGRSPIEFLLKAYKEVCYSRKNHLFASIFTVVYFSFVVQYGDVFSFTMVGKTFTYAIGSDPSAVFFNSKNEDLNAEEVYSKLVTPVFGKGVAYDVPNKVISNRSS